jgi:hypothetical protein
MAANEQRKCVHVPVSARRWRSNVRSLCGASVIVLAIAFWVAVMWTIPMANEAHSRKATRARFAQVALSLVHYSEFHGHLPRSVRYELEQPPADTHPASERRRALYSWRVEIVPYLEAWHGSWDPSKPWDDPANKQLMELSSFYSYHAGPPGGPAQSFSETNALAITGPGTAFGDGKQPPRALKDIPPSTVLVVETRASRIPWPAPGDFDIGTMPRSIQAADGKGISSRHAGGFHVIFADGQVWFLSDKIPFETLEKFFTTQSAAKHDREALLGPFALHRGP